MRASLDTGANVARSSCSTGLAMTGTGLRSLVHSTCYGLNSAALASIRGTLGVDYFWGCSNCSNCFKMLRLFGLFFLFQSFHPFSPNSDSFHNPIACEEQKTICNPSNDRM